LPGASGIDKRCVIKRILPRHLSDERFVRMFLAEARLSLTLQHGNIVPVLDFGEVDGTHYLAMEWIDGRDLGRVLQRARQTGAMVPIPLVLHVALELCRGLAYVHAKEGPDGAPLRLVHRDVSPSNVLVSWEGDVKLADFGIAKMLTSLAETREHELKGKISYMSPEQARGESVDARADVYAAALVLWELCTGRRPQESRSRDEVLARRRDADPIPPPSSLRSDVPAALDRVLARALAPSPVDRIAEVKGLLAEVSQLLARLAPSTTASDLGVFLRRLFATDEGGEALTRARTTPLGRAADVTVEPRTLEAATAALPPLRAQTATEELEPETRPTVALPDEASTGTAPLLAPSRQTVRLEHPLRWGPWVALGSALVAAAAAAVVLGGTTRSHEPVPPRAAEPVRVPTGAAARAEPRASREPEPVPDREPEPIPEREPTPNTRGREPTHGGGPARERPLGRLEVSTRPWAAVIVDGRRQAESTPVVISLPAGWHTVRLVNPEQGLAHVERVFIEAGETARLARRLR
jgi:tRNA A-37 threonylcarbamoyl transferase component Bud32